MKEIFLVEDDDAIRELVKFILTDLEYTVFDFPTANLFENEILLRHPDLILLDIRLPDGDGVNICAGLKNNSITSTIPVILMSAHTDYSVLAKSRANNFISKPFDIDRLIESIEYHIN